MIPTAIKYAAIRIRLYRFHCPVLYSSKTTVRTDKIRNLSKNHIWINTSFLFYASYEKKNRGIGTALPIPASGAYLLSDPAE